MLGVDEGHGEGIEQNGGGLRDGISQTFDGLGRLWTRTVFGRQLSYGYDIASRRTQLTYPDGYSVTYGYTNVDELQSITDSTGALLASYGYDALGFREQLNRQNNANTGYTPNAIEQLQQLTQSFASGSSSYNMTAQFSYNPAGQIVSKTQSNDAAYTWLPSPTNQTISSPADHQNKLATFQSASVASDGNTDVVSGINALTYSYDPLGQLRSASSSSGSVTVDYDPSGMLRRETNGGTITEYLYDGPDLIAEYVNGALAQRFVHGAAADEPLVWFQGSGTSSPSFLHADERGSIIAASNGSGTVTASVKYGSYGESGALVSPFGYTGQLYMPDLQLYYYKARMYSTQTGRFMQPDPMRYGGGLNLYAYAGADPANLADPSGLDPLSPCGAPYGGQGATICGTPLPGIPVNGVSTPASPPPNVAGDGSNNTGQPPQKNQLETVKVTAKRMGPCDQLQGENDTIQPLLDAANNAYNEYPLRPIDMVWPLSALRGIFIHSNFAGQVRALGPPYSAEVSYLGGVPVPYGTPGSIRADAVVGPINAPLYAVELKSGGAIPSPSETAAYYDNLPAGTGVCSIVEADGP